MKYSIFLLPIIISIFISCDSAPTNRIEKAPSAPKPQNDTIAEQKPIIQSIEKDTAASDTLTEYEQMLIKAGFVDISQIDSSIIVDLLYASENNFLQKDLYDGFSKCYLPKPVAEKVKMAQSLLKSQDSSYSLIIYDGTRPHSIQQRMWDELDMPLAKKKKFLARPNIISMHNFGAAVDVSLCIDGEPLDMGTEVDYAGELAYPNLEDYFLENGLLYQEQVDNRKILRNAMLEAGFIYNLYEWWHFSSCKRHIALQKYPLINDFSSYTAPQVLVAEQRDSSERVIFKVQLAAAAKPLSPQHKIFTLKNVSYYKHQNMYKYTTGSFHNLSNAYSYRDSILTTSYNQAFIVCFYKGERIHIKDAIALQE